MASIRKEILIDVPTDAAWDAIRDVGALHTRLVPGFVIATRLEGTDRVVTFANGVVARERIVSIEDGERRLVWSVVGGRFEHHNAAVQVFAAGAGARIVWIADLLPDALAGYVAGLMEQALSAMKRALEAARPEGAAPQA